MANFKGIVKLTEEQFSTLKTNGTITVGETKLTYDPVSTLYVTSGEYASKSYVDGEISTLETDLTNVNTEISTLETNLTTNYATKTYVDNAISNSITTALNTPVQEGLWRKTII